MSEQPTIPTDRSIKSKSLFFEKNKKKLFALGLIAAMVLGIVFTTTALIRNSELPESPYNYEFPEDVPNDSCIIKDIVIDDEYRTNALTINGKTIDFYIINVIINVSNSNKPLDRKDFAIHIKNARSVTVINSTLISNYVILAEKITTNLTIQNSYLQGIEGIFARDIVVSGRNTIFNTSLGIFSDRSDLDMVHNYFANEAFQSVGAATAVFDQNYYEKSVISTGLTAPINQSIPLPFGTFFVLPSPITNAPSVDANPLFPMSASIPNMTITATSPSIVGSLTALVSIEVVNVLHSTINSLEPTEISGTTQIFDITADLVAGLNSLSFTAIDFMNREAVVGVEIFADQYSPLIELISSLQSSYGSVGPGQIEFSITEDSPLESVAVNITYTNETGDAIEYGEVSSSNMFTITQWSAVKNNTIVNITISAEDIWGFDSSFSFSIHKKLFAPVITVAELEPFYGTIGPEISLEIASDSPIQTVIATVYYTNISMQLTSYSETITHSGSYIFNITAWNSVADDTDVTIEIYAEDSLAVFSTLNLTIHKLVLRPSFEFIVSGYYFKAVPNATVNFANLETLEYRLYAGDEFELLKIVPNLVDILNDWSTLSDGKYRITAMYSGNLYSGSKNFDFVKDTAAPVLGSSRVSFSTNNETGQVSTLISIIFYDITPVSVYLEGVLISELNSYQAIYITPFENKTYTLRFEFVDSVGNSLFVDVEIVPPIDQSEIPFEIPITYVSAGILVVAVLLLGNSIRNSIKIRRMMKR